jgi:hypothetical protein
VSRSLELRRRAVAEAFRAVAVEARLDELSRQSAQVLARLASVETALLESAWEAPQSVAECEPGPEQEERVSVPAVPLDEVRMSSTASRALFGD